jgi:NAD(P)-dependent dehydrogenase (short-subunit alcohol dehydrogenase family)
VSTALVTGAGQGIGRAIARRLTEDGYSVIVVDLDAETAKAAAAEVGGRAEVCDISDPDAVHELAATVDDLDVLVNNAGIFPRADFLAMTEEEWDRVLAVNLKGSAFCAQAAARAMVAAGQPGVIINLASAAVRGTPVGVHYSATKNGVVGITRSMALALAPHGIRVNAIAPGLTDPAQPRYGNSDAEVRAMGAALPLGRLGRPEDIAAMAVFLASDQAAWITGQVYHVNGGGYMP